MESDIDIQVFYCDLGLLIVERDGAGYFVYEASLFLRGYLNVLLLVDLIGY
jgi:hypothetical protein